MYARKSSVKRSYRKRSYGSKSSGGLARKALSSVQRLSRMVKPEVKKITETYGATSFTSAGVVYSTLDNVAQGTAYNERVGNQIKSQYMSIDYTLSSTTIASGGAPHEYRFIVFYDKQQIGDTTPAVTDVLQFASVNSPLNPLTVGRFKILKNIRGIMDANNIAYVKNLNFHIPLKSHVIRYNGSLGSDVQVGSLYMLVISSSNSATNTFNGYQRMGYTDV